MNEVNNDTDVDVPAQRSSRKNAPRHVSDFPILGCTVQYTWSLATLDIFSLADFRRIKPFDPATYLPPLGLNSTVFTIA